MKTLKTIQTLSKVGRIISKIIFICCLVGAIGCLAGIVSLAVIPSGIQIGDTTIHGMIENSADISMGSLYAGMAVGAIMCSGEAALSKIAENYFKGELAAGTPFTFDGAKEMMKLAICAICIPLGTQTVAAIVHGIIAAAFSNVAELKLEAFGSGSVGLGVMFIITSLLCRYGAEISQGKDNNNEDTCS